MNAINSIVTVDINGLADEEGTGYNITGEYEITLTAPPVLGSRIGINYLY
jgi:hypothetical protein